MWRLGQELCKGTSSACLKPKHMVIFVVADMI